MGPDALLKLASLSREIVVVIPAHEKGELAYFGSIESGTVTVELGVLRILGYEFYGISILWFTA